MASPSPLSSDIIDWNDFTGVPKSSPTALSTLTQPAWHPEGNGQSLAEQLFLHLSDVPNINYPDGRDPLRREKEDRLLMTLWLLTDSSWSEKQRAIKLVHGFEHSKNRLSQRLTRLKHLETPPLWQPHWRPQQSFVAMHRPSQWTYLEIKLLRQCLAFPPPDPAQFNYDVAAYMMNRAKYQDRPNLTCWRPGGPYTAAEVELCASFMFWRLPKLVVRPTAQWTIFEYGDLLSRFRLDIPLASLVKMMCEKQSQFKENNGVNGSYDGLSIEKAIDNLIVGPRFGPAVVVRFELAREHQEYFGMLGAGGPSLGPDFWIGEKGEVTV